jgi:hypothetical protein
LRTTSTVVHSRLDQSAGEPDVSEDMADGGKGPVRAPLCPHPDRVLPRPSLGTLTCDFPTLEIGLTALNVLIMIELERRRIHSVGVTVHPTGPGSSHAGRNLLLDLDQRAVRFPVPHPRPGRYFHQQHLRYGAESLLPRCWLRRMPGIHGQCLRGALDPNGPNRMSDWMLIWNRRHLEKVVTVYVEHYDSARLHRA